MNPDTLPVPDVTLRLPISRSVTSWIWLNFPVACQNFFFFFLLTPWWRGLPELKWTTSTHESKNFSFCRSTRSCLNAALKLKLRSRVNGIGNVINYDHKKWHWLIKPVERFDKQGGVIQVSNLNPMWLWPTYESQSVKNKMKNMLH